MFTYIMDLSVLGYIAVLYFSNDFLYTSMNSEENINFSDTTISQDNTIICEHLYFGPNAEENMKKNNCDFAIIESNIYNVKRGIY